MISRQGLPKSHRLTGAKAYAAAFNAGSCVRDRQFTIYTVENGQPHARIGLAVSRKVSLKAVVRNRIKRQIREVFRRHQQRLHGLDIVVIARAAAAGLDRARLRGGLEQHWLKIIELCRPC